MKLVVGQEYKTKYCMMTYCGFWKGSNHTCDVCHKERWSVHEFTVGNPNNPSEIWHFGSECVKTIFIGG